MLAAGRPCAHASWLGQE